jgi:hypothetical protein
LICVAEAALAVSVPGAPGGVVSKVVALLVFENEPRLAAASTARTR